MTKKDVGEVLISAGALLLIAPLLMGILATFMYFISMVTFTTDTLIVVGIIGYIAIAIGLIIYGKELMCR